MSLSQHLEDSSSPIRRFFEERFPRTLDLKYADAETPPTLIPSQAGALVFTELLQFSPGTGAVLPADRVDYPWRVAGGAFDYRLRMELGPLDVDTTTAFSGWTDKVRRPLGERAADSGWGQLSDAVSVAQQRRTAGGLRAADEYELARLCGVLALYEQAYRMGGGFNTKTGHLPIWELPLNASLPEMLALIDDRVATDVTALIARARERVHN